MSGFKVPTKKVSSDDCALYLDRRIEDGEVVDTGKAYFVHKGEWVEVLPVGTVSQFIAFGSFRSMGTEEDKLAASGVQFQRMVALVASRVVAWNWTGLDNEPLPQPYKDEAVIAGLHVDELLWLVNAVNSEPAGERKNDSAPSTTK